MNKRKVRKRGWWFTKTCATKTTLTCGTDHVRHQNLARNLPANPAALPFRSSSHTDYSLCINYYADIMVQHMCPISLFPANTYLCVCISLCTIKKKNISNIIFTFWIDQTTTSTNHQKTQLTASRKAAFSRVSLDLQKRYPWPFVVYF